jgi:hypothetical protein
MKLMAFVVVGFAGLRAKEGGGRAPLATTCHWTVVSAALEGLPHKTTAQPRLTIAVALLLAFIVFVLCNKV